MSNSRITMVKQNAIFVLGCLVEEIIADTQVSVCLHYEDGRWSTKFDLQDKNRDKVIFLKILRLYLYQNFTLDTPLTVYCNGEPLYTRNRHSQETQETTDSLQSWLWRGHEFTLRIGETRIAPHC